MKYFKDLSKCMSSEMSKMLLSARIGAKQSTLNSVYDTVELKY